jgi:predicted enzyme related to lactoylglutathione lyase
MIRMRSLQNADVIVSGRNEMSPMKPDFYSAVFGWRLRKDNHGSVSFDDAVGEVSGMWVLDRKPMTEAGLIISIMVDDALSILESIKENGGKVIYSTTMSSGEHIAHFTDPAGNVMGIYQESPKN